MAILITGGASGIGQAVAERLVAAGRAVALVDRDAARLAQCAATLGGTVLPIEADVADAAAAAASVARAAAELGGLDGLVTSAGIFDPGDLAPLADVSLETFTRVLSINLTGTFLFAKHALPHLLRTAAAGAPASIVTVASTAGLRGHGFGSGYTASKGGVVALTRLLAVQYGPEGVRANCVCPGLTNTPMTGGAYDDPETAKAVTRGIPLRRIAEPSEIAGLICHLLGPDASYVNGQIIAADGGATAL